MAFLGWHKNYLAVYYQAPYFYWALGCKTRALRLNIVAEGIASHWSDVLKGLPNDKAIELHCAVSSVSAGARIIHFEKSLSHKEMALYLSRNKTPLFLRKDLYLSYQKIHQTRWCYILALPKNLVQLFDIENSRTRFSLSRITLDHFVFLEWVLDDQLIEKKTLFIFADADQVSMIYVTPGQDWYVVWSRVSESSVQQKTMYLYHRLEAEYPGFLEPEEIVSPFSSLPALPISSLFFIGFDEWISKKTNFSLCLAEYGNLMAKLILMTSGAVDA